MIYTCRDASYIVVQKELSNVGIFVRLRLKLHLLMCKPCSLFEKHIIELSGKMKDISCYHEGHKNFHSMDSKSKNRISRHLDKSA